MAKLTLHVPEDLVSAAKREAAARRVSVSKLVSDYFLALSKPSSAGDLDLEGLAPRTRRLAGCLADQDEDGSSAPDLGIEDYIDYLERKHS